MSAITTAMTAYGLGRTGTSTISTAPTGTSALTMRSALSRMAIHQMPTTKTAIGTAMVYAAARSLSLLELVTTSISTSIPADSAPAAATTK